MLQSELVFLFVSRIESVKKIHFHASRFEFALSFPQVSCDSHHIFKSDGSVSVIGKRASGRAIEY